MGYVVLYLVGLILFWLLLVGYTIYALTHPPRKTYAWAVSRNKPAEPSELDEPVAFTSWSFVSRGRELPVWDMTGGCETGPIVVMTTGWSDSKLGALDRLDVVLPIASRVIAWDMPGHGQAPGVCALGAKEADDLVRLLEVLSEQDNRPIVLFGWSLGAGVSLAAAATIEQTMPGRVLGVVAEAPYQWPWTPARNVLRLRGLPWRSNLRPALALLGLIWLGDPRWKRFDRVKLASQLTCSLLVLHSTFDEICPVEDGRAIAHAARAGAIVEFEHCLHNNLWTSEDRQLAGQAIERFIGDLADEETRECRG